MKSTAIILVLFVAVGAISGLRIRRGYDNSENINGKIEHESTEQDASGSGESIGECGGGDGKRYNSSPEIAYNREGRTPIEDQHATAGRAFSKASASASASSSSYNMNQKNNFIPV